MGKVTRKDIASFAKVLRELSRIAESSPDVLLSLLDGPALDVDPRPADKVVPQPEWLAKVKDTDLYAYAKKHTEGELVDFLCSFSAEELKGFVKKYNLGYTKLKATDSIAKYIATQLKKRTVDVFMRHEK